MSNRVGGIITALVLGGVFITVGFFIGLSMNSQNNVVYELINRLFAVQNDDGIVRMLEIACWPLLILIGISIFASSVENFLGVFTSIFERLIRNTRSIEVKGVRLTFDDVSDLMIEVEKLKAWIDIAAADGEPSEQELKFLFRMRQSLSEGNIQRIKEMEDSVKEDLVDSAVRIGFIDGKLQADEYYRIRELAIKLGYREHLGEIIHHVMNDQNGQGKEIDTKIVSLLEPQ